MSQRSKKDCQCSFCGKSQKMVRKIIASSDVHICDECVVLCAEIICKDGKYELPSNVKVNAAVALSFLGGDQSLGLLIAGMEDPQTLTLKQVVNHIVTEGERLKALQAITEHRALIEELEALEKNLRDPGWPCNDSEPSVSFTARSKKLNRAEELRAQAHKLLQRMQKKDADQNTEDLSLKACPPEGSDPPSSPADES